MVSISALLSHHLMTQQHHEDIVSTISFRVTSDEAAIHTCASSTKGSRLAFALLIVEQGLHIQDIMSGLLHPVAQMGGREEEEMEEHMAVPQAQREMALWPFQT